MIEPSGHRLLNHGDTAMLQVAVRRLREAFPRARIGVLTADPDGLRTHVPGVDAIPAAGRYELIDDASPLPSRRDRVVVAAHAVDGEVAVAERALGRPLGDAAQSYLTALAAADLFVVTGRGGVCDAFHHETSHLLDEVEAATDLGVPVAMMGQGLGPLEHPFLRVRAREVLPKVQLLTLREGRTSLPLAEALGVPAARVTVTGDDALELVLEHGACERAPAGLGVNLRVAGYAGVGEDDLARIGPLMRSVARGLGTHLVGVPISAYPEEDDAVAIERIFGTTGDVGAVDGPAAAIRRASRCRALVTGSYHAALFALAQGVPVIGLARSGYYVDKLHGLAERFGDGITVVSFDAPDLEGELERAVRHWWDAPDERLATLPQAARRQAEAGREAYCRISALVGERAAPPALRHPVREMVVERIETRSDDGSVERSALFRWTGGERRVAIAVPAAMAGPDDDASPFLPLALLPAMRRGDDVVVDGPVSGRLLRGAHAAAELYNAWAPELPRPAIGVAEEREPPAAPGRATGLFFSRGLDSTYSAAVPRAYPGPIERLLFVRGLDPNLPAEVVDEDVRAAGRTADLLDLPLSVLRTNVHDLTRLFVSNWEDVVGAALASIALATVGGLHTVVIAPTDSTASLGQNGTSPLLEPLFSTEATRVVHDSVALRRVSKTLWLAENRPDLLAGLNVCMGERRAGNGGGCGRCRKCVLTMAVLRAAGALEATPSFPNSLDLDLIRSAPIRAFAPRLEYAELVSLLDDGRDPELREVAVEVLRQPLWTYPGAPPRSDSPEFRQRQERILVSVIRDGLRWPPPAPDAAPPGLGLVRAIDRGRGRHVYGVGRVPPGELVGELGSLPRDQTDGLEPVYITASGRIVREPDSAREVPARRLRTSTRWVVAPLGWRGSGIAAGERARTAAARAARLLRRRRDAGAAPLARVASIHVHATPTRLPLFSALHPVTGDQLLTTERLEAADLGYGEPELLGYLDAQAPVTGRLGTERRDVPWASHLGRRVRS